MIGMGFCTGIFFPGEIKAEIFSASVAEFKGVSVQNCAADLTNMGLHVFKVLLITPPPSMGKARVAAGSESLWFGEGWTIRFSPHPLHPLPPGEGRYV